jgi:hypothetical protein
MDIGFSGFRKVIELGMMSRWPIHRSDGGAYGTRIRIGSCVTSAVCTTVRNCTRDEGEPFEVYNQVLISNHRKLLLSKAMVVSVAKTPGQDSGRQG